MNLRCSLCGEDFPAEEWYANINSDGSLVIECPNGCHLEDNSLADMYEDVEWVD